MPWTARPRPTCTIADARQDRAKSRRFNADSNFAVSGELVADLGAYTPHGRPPRTGPPSGRPGRFVEAPARGPHLQSDGVPVASGQKEHQGQNPMRVANSTECKIITTQRNSR